MGPGVGKEAAGGKIFSLALLGALRAETTNFTFLGWQEHISDSTNIC